MNTTSDIFRFREVNTSFSQVTSTTIKDSALLVIDVQRFYAPDGAWPVADILETNERIANLVELYRKSVGEVIWISHTNDATSTLESIKDTPLDFFSGNNNLKPEGDEKFVPKSFGSSFYETDLDNYLKSKGIKDIVLVGYQPQFCVVTTAVIGQHLGYNVFIVRDAIGSHNLRSWDDKRNIRGADFVDSACDLMGDALGTVIQCKDLA